MKRIVAYYMPLLSFLLGVVAGGTLGGLIGLAWYRATDVGGGGGSFAGLAIAGQMILIGGVIGVIPGALGGYLIGTALRDGMLKAISKKEP